MAEKQSPPVVTGRCYCGTTRIAATAAPTKVTYCHCTDCRRITGAPVAAFAAFSSADVTFTPDEGRAVSVNPGVTRTFCRNCGSHIAGTYDYLPGQTYIALGLLDQAEDFPPELHAHAGSGIRWLHIDDELERHEGSARGELRG